MARNWHQPRDPMWRSAPGRWVEWDFKTGVLAVGGGLVSAIIGVLLGVTPLVMAPAGAAVGAFVGNMLSLARTESEHDLRRSSNLDRRPEASNLLMGWLETLGEPGGTVRLGDHPKYRTILTNEGVESRTRFRTLSTPWSGVIGVTGSVVRLGDTTYRDAVRKVRVKADNGRSHVISVDIETFDEVIAVCRIKAREAREGETI